MNYANAPRAKSSRFLRKRSVGVENEELEEAPGTFPANILASLVTEETQLRRAAEWKARQSEVEEEEAPAEETSRPLGFWKIAWAVVVGNMITAVLLGAAFYIVRAFIKAAAEAR